MLNYIKSELYRITHSATLYIVTLCFAAAPLLVNLMLFSFGRSIPDYPYSTTSFSYSNIVANPMFYCIAALCLVFALYEDNKKNGNLKNVVASGISREKIFAGQFIVCLLTAIVVMAITLTVYILSATLLLRNAGPVGIVDMLNEILAVSLVAIAALILGIVVVLLFDQTFLGIACWFGVLFFIPQVLFYIGIEIEPIREIAMWMPRNFFSGMEVNLSVCNPIWNKPLGLATCFISGFIGIIIFSILGILALRKKEL